ncbi:hypothetical protein OIU85_021996 [Salix viminalis]|uniref:Reverse transcriptase zinc-binding domain-containing protein n=1 Tax=Salix viminalis TaxID=40686 RepID=A0A9Q0SAS2_SALVM|nr:hypothetical protein OIU85_021996 [Salix viminalis]
MFPVTPLCFVWGNITSRSGIRWPHLQWQHLIQWTARRYSNKKNCKFIIPKLILSTTVYHVWYERNRRSFQEHHSSAATVAEDIFQFIRSLLGQGNTFAGLPPSQKRIWGV